MSGYQPWMRAAMQADLDRERRKLRRWEIAILCWNGFFLGFFGVRYARSPHITPFQWMYLVVMSLLVIWNIDQLRRINATSPLLHIHTHDDQ